MLLVVGACRGPSLVVEVGVASDQGIVDNCRISRHSRQSQLGCAALVHVVVLLSPLWAETQPCSYTAVCTCIHQQVRRVPVRRVSSSIMDFFRTLGKLYSARGDNCEFPLPMCGGVCASVL